MRLTRLGEHCGPGGLCARTCAALLQTLLALSLLGLTGPAWSAGQVLLYASATTRAFLPGVGGQQEALLQPWRRLLTARRLPHRESGHLADLEALKAEDVLILPSAVALDGPERQALLRLRDRGVHLLVTWSAGSRDARGRWAGHQFAQELTGFTIRGELDPAAKRPFLLPHGDTALNQQLPAGRRIWLGELAERPLRLSGGQAGASYLDWARTVLRRGETEAAIVYDEGGGRRGRRVLFGYAETAWSFSPADYEALAEQALAWLLRQPRAQIAAWPNGARAAQLIEMDTEDGFANAIHFAELMEQMNAAGTFYCLSSEARRHPELLRRLVTKHEVSFHGEVHFGFRGLPRDKQLRRLERMLAEMSEVLGSRDGWPAGAGRGFRAPTESYDETTEALLVAMGFEHHAADPQRSEDRLPLLVWPATATPAAHAEGSASPARLPLVVLPRGQLDDLNYMELMLGADDVGQAVVAEYEFNLQLGGLGLLSVHSQNFADPQRWLARPRHTPLMTLALEALVRHVGPRHDRAWIAPGDRIARWWRERSRVRLDSRPAGDGLELELQVGGERPVQGLTLLLPLRHEGRSPQLRAQPTTPAAQARLRTLDRFTAALVFAELPPGRHRLSVSLP